MKEKKLTKENIKKCAIKVGQIGLVCGGVYIAHQHGVYRGAYRCAEVINELMSDSEKPLQMAIDGTEIDFVKFSDVFIEKIMK